MFTFFLFILIGCKKDPSTFDDKILLSGIDFKPNVFTENGQNVGVDVDIASEIFKNAGIEFSIELEDSWDKAYNSTLNGSNKGLLTVAFSKDRKNLFKW